MSDYELSDEGEDAYDSEFSIEYDDESQNALNKGKHPAAERVAYDSFSSGRLRARIDQEVADVVSVLGVDPSLALIMLLHFNWNRERLIEKFTDGPSSVLAAVGGPTDQAPGLGPAPAAAPAQSPPRKRLRLRSRLIPSLTRARARVPAPPPAPTLKEGELLCGVCCDTCAEADAPALRCVHQFCRACWGAYLAAKVKDEGQCMIRCMSEQCPTVVDEAFLRDVVDEALVQRWQTLTIQSFVSANNDFRFCPHPGCEEAVFCAGARGSYLLTHVPSVVCGAEHTFCFGCGLDGGHTPVICKIAALWVNSRDSGTSEWLKANTRDCPKCNNNIEKAGGCNRMVCRHCKFQFCWMCRKNWDVHGYNNTVCNAFVEPPRDASMTEAAVNLERWLFYFDRFSNHELSSKLDQELVDGMEAKMLDIQKSSDLSWIETQFMRRAVTELTKCRQTLKWTYAMAHFLQKGNSKAMFEDIQADLEKAVEKLSQMLDAPIDEGSIKELRQGVTDQTVYVQKRHEIMLDDVAKGLAEGSWEWTVSVE